MMGVAATELVCLWKQEGSPVSVQIASCASTTLPNSVGQQACTDQNSAVSAVIERQDCAESTPAPLRCAPGGPRPRQVADDDAHSRAVCVVAAHGLAAAVQSEVLR